MSMTKLNGFNELSNRQQREFHLENPL